MTEYEQGQADTVAVIGMAARLAGAPDVETFWANLQAGACAVRPLTEEELAAVDPAVRANPNFVGVAADVADAELWDANFFGFSPRIAELTDPQNRLFLELCWQALEHAGYDPVGVPGVTGVIAGSGFPTYLQNNILGHWDVIAEVGHVQLAIGNDRDSLSTMVAYKLNLRGPSFTVQTACSTSMLAVHLACNSLLTFESDVMLAGGVAIQTPQNGGYLYEEGGILAPDGVVRSLDAKGQGGVFGNGVGVVVLKRTEDAIRDGDRIYAEILGSATNNDGIGRAGFAAPGVRGQSEVIVEALGNADISPDTVSYVEAHGTGTLLGDAIELDAVSRGFLPRDPAVGACVIGSVKSNIGHTDRASGVLGLIKTSLMLYEKRIPVQVNFDSPNANLDLSSGAFRVVTSTQDWPEGAGPRRALVNSFGMGGTNAVAVLQEAPEHQPRTSVRKSPHVLVLSARTEGALEEATRNLHAHLAAHPELDVADVAFTLQTGRTAFNHRRALVCTGVADAVAALAQPRSAPVHTAHQTKRHREVVLLVPDEASAAIGVERDLGPALYEAEPAFRAAFSECADALGLADSQVWTAQCRGVVIRYALARWLLSIGVGAQRFAGIGTGAAVAECLSGTLPLSALATNREEDPSLTGLVADQDVVLVEIGDGRLLRALATGQSNTDEGARLAVYPETGELARAGYDLIGRLWLAGADPDWSALHADRPPRRVALPSYPFERRRLWLDPTPLGIAPPRGEARNEDIGEWFYAPVWRQSPRLRQAEPDARLAEAGPWLIAGTEATVGLCDALRDRLRRAGATVRTVLDPNEASGAGPSPKIVIHTGAAEDTTEHGGLAGFERTQRVGFDSVRRLVGRLISAAGAEPQRILVLARGAARVSDVDPLVPAHAGLVGLARVVPQENPGLRCRVIDIGESFVIGDDRVTDALLADAVDNDSATLAYRGEQRWRQDYEQLPIPENNSFRTGGTYVLTGGLGQVCLAVAGHLAERYQAQLTLLARTPLPEESSWADWLREHPADDRTSARIMAVRALRAAGAEVLVVAADVADPAQVAAALDQVRKRFGEPHGVLHGAGVQAEEFFGVSHELTEAQCLEHYRSKVFGLAAIAEAVDLDRLDFCVTLSSLATVLGAIGHAPYAAANAAMDALAQSLFDAGHRRVLSVDWDSWPSGTDVAELGASTTVAKYRMSYPEGIKALKRVLGAVGSLPRLVNSTGDLATRLAAWVDVSDAQETAGDGERHPRPPLATPYVAPADEVERDITEVWQDVMGLTGIGVLDNFFELGGHSLMAVRMIGRIRKSVGGNVPIAVLAECPTVRELAYKIKSLGTAQDVPAAAQTGGM